MEACSCFVPVGKTPGRLFSLAPVLPVLRSRKGRCAGSIGVAAGNRPGASGSKPGNGGVTALEDLPGDRRTRTGAVLMDVPEASDENRRISDEMRKEAEDSLEWRSVCSQVAAFASTSMGRDLCTVGGLPIGRDRGESQKLLDQTMAAVLLPRPLDFSGVDDISRIVSSAVSGKVLSIGELCAVERSLRAARGVYDQMMELSSVDGLSSRCVARPSPH